MQKYRCHKIVEAQDLNDRNVEVEKLPNGSLSVIIDYGKTGESLNIAANHVGEHTAEEMRDGYVVRYSDGYVSWSPRQPFEDGYAAIPPDAN